MTSVNNAVDPKPKRMVDSFPLKKYEIIENDNDEVRGHSMYPKAVVEYYKVEDVEALLQKLSDPAKLTYIMKTLAFGKPLSLEEILK